MEKIVGKIDDYKDQPEFPIFFGLPLVLLLMNLGNITYILSIFIVVFIEKYYYKKYSREDILDLKKISLIVFNTISELFGGYKR